MTTPHELSEVLTRFNDICTELEQKIPAMEPLLGTMETPDMLRVWALLDWLKSAAKDMSEKAGSMKAPFGKAAHGRLTAAGVDGIEFDGCRWKPAVKNNITCASDQKDALLIYARTEDLELGELIKEDIHQKSLESYFAKKLAEGATIPEMIKVFPMETVTRTAVAKKKVKE